jgi:PIN domain nuclease of toxin-antitoxin system
MGMLHSKGRIRLKTDALTWVRKALAASGISLLAISPEIAIESTRLPGEYHGDPADRIIIATARIMSGAIATRDRKMIDYCTQGFAKLAPLSPPV